MNALDSSGDFLLHCSTSGAESSSSSSKNPNLTNGESPPPKEIPDMSSATFVSVVSVIDRGVLLFCR